MNSFRPMVAATLGLALVMAHAEAAWPSDPIPLPRERPASKTAKPEQAARPLSLAPDAATATAANATSPAVQPPSSIKSLVAPRIVAPFAPAATTATSPLDLSAVKQALDLVRKNRQDEATTGANSITDPVARKLVEWVILRSEDGANDFSRYSAFINANPSWPSIPLLRRRAEFSALAGPYRPTSGDRFLCQRSATFRQRSFCFGPRALDAGRRPARFSDFARGLARRCVLFRSRGAGARDVWRFDHAG